MSASPSRKGNNKLKRLGINISEVGGCHVLGSSPCWLWPALCLKLWCMPASAYVSRFPLCAPATHPLQASKEVDLPMLQQLQPMAGARVRDLEAEASDNNTSRGKRVSSAGDVYSALNNLSSEMCSLCTLQTDSNPLSRILASLVAVAGQDDQGSKGRGACAAGAAEHTPRPLPAHDEDHQQPGGWVIDAVVAACQIKTRSRYQQTGKSLQALLCSAPPS